MTTMRRTVWTLLAAWLLQLLLASSGWALAHASATQADAPSHSALPCHGAAAPRADHAAHEPPTKPPSEPRWRDGPSQHSVDAAHHTAHPPGAHGPGDSHHCCAVGLGLGVAPQLAPLPQAAPQSVARAWLSLSTRPDLRPPI